MCGIAAAALFGMSAPLAKVLLPSSEPIVLAGLLYLGAAVALSVARVRRVGAVEAGLRLKDIPLLLAIIVTGGVLGPVLMLLGLERVSGVAGSLLLNLEAPFTMVVAVVVFREHMSRRGLAAAVLIVGGGLALAHSAGEFSANSAGAMLLAAACVCWAAGQQPHAASLAPGSGRDRAVEGRWSSIRESLAGCRRRARSAP